MQRYVNVIQDNTGLALSGVTVTVYLTGTVTLASLFSSNAGAVKSNPFTNDSDGSVEFYAANGRYDIVFTKSGYSFTAANSTDILFEDVADGLVSGSIVSAGLVLATDTMTLRTLADRFTDYANPFDFDAVGDGVTDDTQAVTDTVAHALANDMPVFWPNTIFLTTANIPDFHGVIHRGEGAVKRGSNLFYPDPSMNPGGTNNIFVSTTGNDDNDGLGTSQAMLTAQAAGNLIYRYTYGDVTWKINFAAGTYTVASCTFSKPFPSVNRVQFLGASVSAGVQPTTKFQATGHGVGVAVQGLYFQNYIRAQVSNINFKNYRKDASPNGNELGSGLIADTFCELYTVNVWTDDCDQGIYVTNGSEARIQSGRHGFNLVNGTSIQFIRHSKGTVGYNGSAASATGDTGVALIGGAYGVMIQEFAMAHVDYTYHSAQTQAGNFITTGRVHSVSSTYINCAIGIDGRFNANIGTTSPTFTTCTNNIFCRSGSKLAGTGSVVAATALEFNSPGRTTDAVVSTNNTVTPVTAFTQSFLANELQNRGTGFDVEIWWTRTNGNDTKTVTVALGAVTLLAATLAATTVSAIIIVKMRVVTNTNSLQVMTEVRENGVLPLIVWSSVTTVDLSAAQDLTVTHQVANVSDTSNVRNVDCFIHR